MKKMNPGMMAIMAKKKESPVVKKEGKMPMKDGKPAFLSDSKGMKKGGIASAPKKMMSGGMAMKHGGKVHSDATKDKPMMKKVAKEEVKGHEKKMHGMAKGGGIEVRGKTKGKMIGMKKGGAC